MKIIYLNAIVQLPTAEAEERIQNATKGNKQVKDGHTPSRQWFLEQNLTPPKDAVDDEIEYDDYGNVLLDESDFEEVPVPVSIPLDNLGSWVANVNGGSTIYTKSNLSYDVVEEIWEVGTMVEYLSMSWIEKQFLLFKSFFAELKWKLSKENKQLENINNNGRQD